MNGIDIDDSVVGLVGFGCIGMNFAKWCSNSAYKKRKDRALHLFYRAGYRKKVTTLRHKEDPLLRAAQEDRRRISARRICIL